MRDLPTRHAQGIFDWIVSDDARRPARRPRRRTARCTTRNSSPTAGTGWYDCPACRRSGFTGAKGIDAAISLGNETLDRASSVTGKLSNGIAERARRWLGDEEERDEEG